MREMKDSGHETIGLVPSDWTEKRLKYLCKIQTGNEDTQNANPEGKYPFYVRSPIVEHCDRYTFDGEEFWSRETVLVQGAFSTMYMENTQFINVFIVCHILRVMRISFIIT